MTGKGKWVAAAAIGWILAMLSACQTPAGPVEVTRFHRLAAGEMLNPPTVRIVPAEQPLHINEQRLFEAAVARQLQQLGLGVSEPLAPAANPAFRAAVRVTIDQSQTPASDSPVSVGVGGSVGSYGSGVGIGIAINPASRRPVQTITLSVRISRDVDDQAIWEGSAVHHARAGTPAAQPGLVAPHMAEALFKGFPGQSGATIVVP